MIRKHLSTFVIVALVAIQTQALIHSPPRITKQPPTDELLFQVPLQSKETNRPFIIECEAEGEPEPKYRWIKNGQKFEWQVYDNRMSQQPGRGTLTITIPRDEDLGQYQCFAENEHGIATSNSVFVRKAELNSFKDEPAKTIQANEGDPFKLQCQPPDGWPKPQVNWMIESTLGSIRSINNSRMTVDPEGNLWFSNVTRWDESDDSYYSCSANSVFRYEYKIGNRVLLEVIKTSVSPTQNRHQPVRQYVTRKNEVAIRGKRVELYCIFGGTPLPQISWTKNGSSIAWSDRVSQGNYGKSIIIKQASFEDTGSYTCEASNGVGNANSYTIHLQVLAVPYFLVEPEIQNAAEEESVEFRCEATGIPEPTIKWIHNGKPIAEAPQNDRRIVSTNSIVINNLIKTDTGNYGCNATNALGYVYKDVYLNVLSAPPEITEPPRRQSTVDSRNVTMTCRVFGAPKPIVKWIRNGQELTGGRYTVQETGDLLITNVAFADAGEYTCHAVNKFASKEANGTLIVKEHTRITDEPQNYEVSAGSPATFRCNAVSDSSLNLEIKWLRNNVEIELDTEPRFVRTNDNSLTISKTVELDSAVYTCVASTELDEASAQATLIVQDVPNPPELTGIKCNSENADISWKSLGDNRAPILFFTIQYNTSFTPDTWEVAFDKVPATDFTYTVAMSPWANYTFRILAHNKIGPSLPSGHSGVCTTQPSVPHKNPDNVEGKGSEPTNLVIRWTVMPEIDHNAPGFRYVVYWKRDIAAEQWNIQEILDWETYQIIIQDQPVFERYRIKVVAVNEMGESNTAAKEVIGWSGEDKPTQAPANFTMLQIIGTDALFQWDPVPPETVRGHFKGYKLQTWSEEDGETRAREIYTTSNATSVLVQKCTPDTKNFARVLVYNSRFTGPPSAVVDFITPEGVPSSVQSFEAYPMGSSAFLLVWKKPLRPNGKLTGYRIYYEQVEGTMLKNKLEREPHIDDPRITRAKLAGLDPDKKYRLYIAATTKMGEGELYFIERRTNVGGSVPPDVPHFMLEQMPTETNARVKVTWQPNLEGKPGSHFFVKYRKKGESMWEQTPYEMLEDYYVVQGLEPDTNYEFVVVAVDGNHLTESQIQEIDTYDSPIKVPSENVATAGWFIGMMLAIAFLILLLIIVCIVRRNRGGKYDVHDREVANGRRDYPEEGGFHEYSQPLDNKSAGRQSVASNLTKPDEDDADSMAEYGDGDTGQFTEDGSFIGQYVPGKLQPPVSPPATSHNSSTPQAMTVGVGGSGAIATYV